MKSRHFLKAILVGCLVFALTGTMEVSAATYTICSVCNGTGRTMCPSCAGSGRRSVTIYVNQTIGWNSVTGMPTTIMLPRTDTYPCSSCGGSGKMYCPSCSGTGRKLVGSSSSSSTITTTTTTTTKKVKNGTVLEATEGVVSSECGPNLLDGDTSTKFNVKATSLYIIWKAPKKIRVKSYVMTTANDTSIYTGRNPKTWVLYGSNKKLSRDAKGWKKIHSVTNDKKLKPVDYKSYTYKLKKASKAYQYFKLEIKDNKGCDCTQLSEFTLKAK